MKNGCQWSCMSLPRSFKTYDLCIKYAAKFAASISKHINNIANKMEKQINA